MAKLRAITCRWAPTSLLKTHQEVKAGQKIVKIPRKLGKIQDITGGLPRVTELFEARNPSNPAIVSEIDGVVSFGKIKRGNREVLWSRPKTARTQVPDRLVQAHAGSGRRLRARRYAAVRWHIAPKDILAIKGPFAVQSYLVNGVQEVYRSQGITINNKHMEVIVRQMMRRVQIEDPGDTTFLEGEAVEKYDFLEPTTGFSTRKSSRIRANLQRLKGRPAGDPAPGAGRKLLPQAQRQKSWLPPARRVYRDAVSCYFQPDVARVSPASLGTDSWISAASFQETYQGTQHGCHRRQARQTSAICRL
jgi:DNA-directed RNA polymerase subunit beta'